MQYNKYIVQAINKKEIHSMGQKNLHVGSANSTYLDIVFGPHKRNLSVAFFNFFKRELIKMLACKMGI